MLWRLSAFSSMCRTLCGRNCLPFTTTLWVRYRAAISESERCSSRRPFSGLKECRKTRSGPSPSRLTTRRAPARRPSPPPGETEGRSSRDLQAALAHRDPTVRSVGDHHLAGKMALRGACHLAAGQRPLGRIILFGSRTDRQGVANIGAGHQPAGGGISHHGPRHRRREGPA